MTNTERAEQILKKWWGQEPQLYTGFPRLYTGLAALIAEALDEAEHRGAVLAT